MGFIRSISASLIFAGAISLAFADTVTVTINQVNSKGVGAAIGTITFTDSNNGLVIKPDLKGLSAGDHGFHIHQIPDCGAKEQDGKVTPGLAAGGHFDPSRTDKHEGPKGHGHQGDLPALNVSDNGVANTAMTADRLKVADIRDHSVMIHEGGDNYSDQPKPLGGGGARIACGVVK